jgi:hypothetical protein
MDFQKKTQFYIIWEKKKKRILQNIWIEREGNVEAFGIPSSQELDLTYLWVFAELYSILVL